MFINRIKENFSKKTRTTSVRSLVLSIINYGIKIWGTANKTNMQKIQKLQNFAAKVALGGGAKRNHVMPFKGTRLAEGKQKIRVRTRSNDL